MEKTLQPNRTRAVLGGVTRMRFPSIDELIAAVDEHSGNSLYGDLWRVSLKARECLSRFVHDYEIAKAAIEELDQHIERIEKSWLEDD